MDSLLLSDSGTLRVVHGAENAFVEIDKVEAGYFWGIDEDIDYNISRAFLTLLYSALEDAAIRGRGAMTCYLCSHYVLDSMANSVCRVLIQTLGQTCLCLHYSYY